MRTRCRRSHVPQAVRGAARKPSQARPTTPPASTWLRRPRAHSSRAGSTTTLSRSVPPFAPRVRHLSERRFRSSQEASLIWTRPPATLQPPGLEEDLLCRFQRTIRRNESELTIHDLRDNKGASSEL